jgi:hypothetical protein
MAVMMRQEALAGIGPVDRIPWWGFGHARVGWFVARLGAARGVPGARRRAARVFRGPGGLDPPPTHTSG